MTQEEDSGLDEALYGDEPERDESKAESTYSKSEESVDEEAAENLTALLPLSALGGKAKSGDTITMRVVKVLGDEVSVEISESTEDDETESDENADELRELEELEV